MSRRARILAFALAVGTTVACDDGAGVTMADLVGTYEATTFLGSDGQVQTDVLEEGGSLTIALNQDGTTTGAMFVPGGADDGSDLEADLTGTWSLAGDRVDFEHEAKTFVRDVLWRFNDHQLFMADVNLQVVLTRQ